MGTVQVIAATHSAILLGCPGAGLLSFDGGTIRPILWRETEHYQVTRSFLEAPEATAPTYSRMNRRACMSEPAVSKWSAPAEDTTREGHAEALRRLRDCAAGAGSWAAAVSAELQRGKLLGLNTGGEAEAATVYGRLSPAERRASIGDLIRQWHRQGLVPVDVCQSMVTLELERRRSGAAAENTVDASECALDNNHT